MAKILFTFLFIALSCCNASRAQQESNQSVLEPTNEPLILDPEVTPAEFEQVDPLMTAPTVAPSDMNSSSLLTEELNAISPAQSVVQPATPTAACGCNNVVSPLATTPVPVVGALIDNTPESRLPMMTQPVYRGYSATNFRRAAVPVASQRPILHAFRPFYGGPNCLPGRGYSAATVRRGFAIMRPYR